MFPSRSLIFLATLAACAEVETIGQVPEMTAPATSPEYMAMVSPGLPASITVTATDSEATGASLWTGDWGSLLGDNRAMQRGDILTVVIEIDDSAQITNQTDRSRQGDQELNIGALFGGPQRWETGLSEGASFSPAVDLGSSSSFSGEGSVRRGEQLTLRVAATVVDVLPNGVFSIMGSQEVRVNYEIRELLVSGFVRPADITRQNEITYDNIASARISYGGRGQISAMQQPRYGQQALEAIVPF
jgi:flagellar L-ring protein FlgH